MKPQKPLNIANLSEAPAFTALSVNKKPSDHKIVHIGIGAFSRAHQALYTQIANDKTGSHWTIVGVSLRSPGVRNTLKQQDYLYTIMERSLSRTNLRCITCLEDIVVGSEDPNSVLEQLASEPTKIVTITVTEKGYCQKNQHLDTSNADVAADIKSGLPTTMPAYLAHGLLKRKNMGLAGLTIISCDNLPNNGEILKNVVKDFAYTLDTDLGLWIDANVKFCSTMVDRIVPAATAQVIEAISEAVGLVDEGALLCEPFRQWVIEDNFAGTRPEWEAAGALLVTDVAAYEKLKLRMLNGCHSAIAYIGTLLGDEYIHETIARPTVQEFIRRLMGDEQSQSLEVPRGIDITAYSETIIERFENKYVPYRNAQVATDGSLKLPQRLLFSALDLNNKGISAEFIALSVAAWVSYLMVYQKTKGYSVNDPNLALLETIVAANIDSAEAVVQHLIAEAGVFPQPLQSDAEFTDAIIRHLIKIQEEGVERAISVVITR
ncbi:mannitol dehydrogenase family protein [Gilvimarinus polysaccharolyticus]|uniref:mannitol dehydrogenase family protein n=1 Tax=Gilvimarinus polysaccharolyticus TaxID=863921 RepID=UPI0006734C37|nr:mannitol dehydrogenase family protein [Gilvimarinus polysaccharolyticus]